MTTTIRIAGLTCGHCVQSVVEEVSQIEGVESVEVDLVAHGISTATITAATAIDVAALAAAIAEAGYSLA